MILTFREYLESQIEDQTSRIMIYISSKGCVELAIVYKDLECALKYSSEELLASMVDEFQPHLNPFTEKDEYWITICHPLERGVNENCK